MRAVTLLSFFCCAVTFAQAVSWPEARKSKELAAERLSQPFEDLKKLATPMPAPGPGDWLDQHREEGQSFATYRRARPVRPGTRLKTIYILPLGDFNADQKKILMLTAEYMKLYFGMPVKIQKAVRLSSIPAKAQRTHPAWGDKQILSTYVLHDLLKERRPADAVAVIALTTSDLWPGKGWNFVYGQASLRERVGVWSMYRNGNPSGDSDEFALCLRRTLKTATHETGHILTIRHCIAYACNMNGSNHRQESDSQPLGLCPVCLQKLCWNANIRPGLRFDRLAEFFKKNNLPEAHKAAAAAANAVRQR